MKKIRLISIAITTICLLFYACTNETAQTKERKPQSEMVDQQQTNSVNNLNWELLYKYEDKNIGDLYDQAPDFRELIKQRLGKKHNLITNVEAKAARILREENYLILSGTVKNGLPGDEGFSYSSSRLIIDVPKQNLFALNYESDSNQFEYFFDDKSELPPPVLETLENYYPQFPKNKMKYIHATPERSYKAMQEEPELHFCCSGFSAKNVSASSTLPDQSGNNYAVSNLGDNNPFTAWIEGAAGDGVGETIEFEYSYDSAFAESAEGAFNYSDTWLFLNGYQKNMETWKANSRIKRLKMFIDGDFYAIIDFLDLPGEQQVKLDFLKDFEKNKGTISVKLEIVEVFPGEKYQDAGISEIVW